MSPWEVILAAVGGQAVLLITLGLLARSLLKHWLGKDLERYKSDIQKEHELALARSSHELTLLAQEHSLKATQLQTRRADVIAEIYGLLADVEWEIRSRVNDVDLTGLRTNDAQRALVSAKVEAFFRYFNRNRIYLPTDTCDAVWLLMNGMVDASNKIRVLEGGGRPDGRLTDAQIEAFVSANDHFTRHHDGARRKLEDVLRRIMGDRDC